MSDYSVLDIDESGQMIECDIDSLLTIFCRGIVCKYYLNTNIYIYVCLLTMLTSGNLHIYYLRDKMSPKLDYIYVYQLQR